MTVEKTARKKTEGGKDKFSGWRSKLKCPIPRRCPIRKIAESTQILFGGECAMLATIENEAPFRQTENEVWFHLLDVVNKAAPEQLKKEATPIYDFATIFAPIKLLPRSSDHAERHRQGYTEVPSNPKDNAAGIAKCYQVGFQINAQEDNPMMVVRRRFAGGHAARNRRSARSHALQAQTRRAVHRYRNIFSKLSASCAGTASFVCIHAARQNVFRLKPTAVAAEPATNPMVYLLGLGLSRLVRFFDHVLSVREAQET